jgi:hypothetical protein
LPLHDNAQFLVIGKRISSSLCNFNGGPNLPLCENENHSFVRIGPKEHDDFDDLNRFGENDCTLLWATDGPVNLAKQNEKRTKG